MVVPMAVMKADKLVDLKAVNLASALGQKLAGLKVLMSVLKWGWLQVHLMAAK